MGTKTIGLAALAATFLMAWETHAVILHTCETVNSIIARADDEVCDFFVEASEDCFGKLNERFALLEARPAKTPPKDILTEAEPIKESYEAAIATVKTYIPEMKPDMCGDQRVKVDVMLQELRVDLRDVSKKISQAKARLK